ncbi:trypsin-like cysteine/serine peptidase domain-containing protein [Aspergillus multicolor]|uniref:serine protease n=1 Tax=Aspergillus multicolor TaxID=41759 RepID=UPI003CCD392D
MKLQLTIPSLLLLQITFPSVLGLTDKNAEKRITGGSEIPITQAPYQAALFVYGNFGGGGSILNHNTILTAAHCVSGPAPAAFNVRVGSSSYLSGGTLLNVSSVTKHPAYNQPVVYENDIAVLTLAENLTFGEAVQPVNLPAQAPFPSAGEHVFISGWGDTKTSGMIQAQLRGVTVDVLNQTECKSRYADYVIPITDGMFCNGVSGGGKGPCKGDSGGPVVSLGEGESVLAGIVSWGLGCGSEARPQVSTNVAYYRDWIRQVAGV